MFKLQSKITPFLWYDDQAGDAAALYIELFGTGRVVHTQHWARARRTQPAASWRSASSFTTSR